MLRKVVPISLAIALLVMLGFTGVARAATPALGSEQDLGPAIPGSFLSPESALGVAEDGRLLAFYISNGNDELPMMLQVVDVEAQEVIFSERVPAGVNSWASDFSDVEKKVYFASTDGHLYSWKPGDATVTSLGQPVGDGEGIWRLRVAPDGVLYGGTYPGGKLFSLNPADGSVRDYGQVNPGETYVRSIAVDDKYVFAGSQPNAKLSRIDRVSGESTPVDTTLVGENAVYDLTLAGEYLFARVESSNTLLVIDRDSLTVVDKVEKIKGRVISELDPSGEFVLFRLDNGVDPAGIYRYYLADHAIERTGFSPNALPGDFIWHKFDDQEQFPGDTLVMTYYRGRTYAKNFESGASLYLGESMLTPTPNPIQEVAAGPDGKIYASGFLSPPSLAQFDPATDSFTQLPGASQVEGFGVFDNYLVMGRYPNAGMIAYDTTQPWKFGENPKDPVHLGHEQDRPQALIRVGDRVAIGSVPKSGRLGGAISMWDIASGAIETYPNLVEHQAPVSLAERDGLIYFGTTINGGYGIDPVASEAKLGIFDPSSGEVIFSIVPVPGVSNVTALAFDGEGKLWGIADGALIVFDPVTRQVERVEQVFPKHRTMYGTSSTLMFHADGYIYSTSAGSLWRVDPQTFERVALAEQGVKYLAQDESGDLYFARGTKLYRWNFGLPATRDLTAPSTTHLIQNEGGTAEELSVMLEAHDEGGTVVETQYRVNGGQWETYSMPIRFDGAGEFSVEYRSVDASGNVEGIKWVHVAVAEPPIVEDLKVRLTGPGSKPVGKQMLVRGTAEGAEGLPVIIQRLDGDEWHAVAEGVVESNGSFLVDVSEETAAPGDHVLRAVVGGTESARLALRRFHPGGRPNSPPSANE